MVPKCFGKYCFAFRLICAINTYKDGIFQQLLVHILTAVVVEILQVTSFWLRGNMCTQYMWKWTILLAVGAELLPGWLLSLPGNTYTQYKWKLHILPALGIKNVCLTSWGHCVTFQEHYLMILQHCLTFWDHSLTFPEHCLTFYEHCLTFPEHCLTFQEHCFMMFWFHIPDSYEYDWTEIIWTSFGICLELQNETGEYGRPFNLFLNESISHWGVTCLVLQDGCNDECSDIFHGLESIAG